MKDNKSIDVKALVKEINNNKAPTFQKNKRIDYTMKAIKSSKATNNIEIQANNRKVAIGAKKAMIDAFK